MIPFMGTASFGPGSAETLQAPWCQLSLCELPWPHSTAGSINAVCFCAPGGTREEEGRGHHSAFIAQWKEQQCCHCQWKEGPFSNEGEQVEKGQDLNN